MILTIQCSELTNSGTRFHYINSNHICRVDIASTVYQKITISVTLQIYTLFFPCHVLWEVLKMTKIKFLNGCKCEA